jgi:hypothetical protein
MREQKPDLRDAGGQAREGSVILTAAQGRMVRIYKHLSPFVENTIPQNHQFVNSRFVILGKKGVIIYNFFLFSPMGGGKCPKLDNW